MNKTLILLVFVPIALGFEIEFLLDDVFTNVTYDKPFKVINNESIQYNVSFTYCVDETCETTVIPKINSYKTAGFAEIKVEKEGNFTLCAKIDHFICQNYTARRPKACNISLKTSFEKFVYESGEKVKFKHSLDTQYPYLIEYHIVDLHGNIVKKRYNTSNTNTKSFTRDVESDTVFSLQSTVHSICQSAPVSNYFVVRGTEPGNTSISIKGIKATCEKVLVHLDIYKGDTRKTVVEMRLKDKRYVADPVKLYLYEKNRGYELKIPILPKGSFTDPTLAVKGLGIEREQKVKLSCKTESAQVIKTIEPSLKITDIDYDCGEFVRVMFELEKGTSKKRVEEIYIKDGRYLATERYKLKFNRSQTMLLSMRLNRNYTDKMTIYFKGIVDANRTLDFDCEMKSCPVCNLPPVLRPQIINSTCNYAVYDRKSRPEFFIFPFLAILCIILLFR